MSFLATRRPTVNLKRSREDEAAMHYNSKLPEPSHRVAIVGEVPHYPFNNKHVSWVSVDSDPMSAAGWNSTNDATGASKNSKPAFYNEVRVPLIKKPRSSVALDPEMVTIRRWNEVFKAQDTFAHPIPTELGNFSQQAIPKDPLFGDSWPERDTRLGPAFEPGAKDVLCGHFGSREAHRSHTGNRRFRVIIEMSLKRYRKASPSDKTQIAKEIVDLVRESGGHFVYRKDGSWRDIGNLKARKRVGCDLRAALERQERYQVKELCAEEEDKKCQNADQPQVLPPTSTSAVPLGSTAANGYILTIPLRSAMNMLAQTHGLPPIGRLPLFSPLPEAGVHQYPVRALPPQPMKVASAKIAPSRRVPAPQPSLTSEPSENENAVAEAVIHQHPVRALPPQPMNVASATIAPSRRVPAPQPSLTSDPSENENAMSALLMLSSRENWDYST